MLLQGGMIRLVGKVVGFRHSVMAGDGVGSEGGDGEGHDSTAC